uniref:Uncharacterized protein n=1 Tax=Geladintestivirus 1 TaxID=3233133 RepID=A0AAU8MHY7_9CAUD
MIISVMFLFVKMYRNYIILLHTLYIISIFV